MSLRAEVDSVAWYHAIELPGGIVTQGQFDTITAAKRVPLPASLRGRRCLDVGTANGFWAFEMERRGAAEVVAVDVDDAGGYDWPGTPTGRKGTISSAFTPITDGASRSHTPRSAQAWSGAT